MFVVLKHLLNWKYLAEAGENKIMNPPWGNKTTVFLVRYSKLKSGTRQISKSLNFSALISYPCSLYSLPLTPYTPISSSFPSPSRLKNNLYKHLKHNNMCQLVSSRPRGSPDSNSNSQTPTYCRATLSSKNSCFT